MFMVIAITTKRLTINLLMIYCIGWNRSLCGSETLQIVRISRESVAIDFEPFIHWCLLYINQVRRNRSLRVCECQILLRYSWEYSSRPSWYPKIFIVMFISVPELNQIYLTRAPISCFLKPVWFHLPDQRVWRQGFWNVRWVVTCNSWSFYEVICTVLKAPRSLQGWE
jgi:hypothetical protein